MGCPFQLQSNQIRGLDTVKIFPVIQWLVGKVIKTREETGDLLRIFSESQFKKRNKLPQDEKLESVKPNALSFVSDVSARYKPTRKYKRPTGARTSKDEESRVESVLLEYGYLQWASRGLEEDENAAEGRGAGASTIKLGQQMLASGPTREQREEEERKKKQEKIETHMKSMVVTTEGGSVATGMVGNLVGYDAEIISEIASKYASGDAPMDEKQLKKVYGQEVHKRQKLKREQKLAAQQEKLKVIEESHNSLQSRLDLLQEEFNKKAALNKRIEAEIEKLNALETPENKEILDMLRGLVALNESFKQQETSFRQSCKDQMEDLQQKIQALKESGPDGTDNKRIQDIEAAYQTETQRLGDARSLAAKKTREIALVQRQIDEIPSRSELQQYQRQFLELYEQVSTKFTETRKYYNSFNTLTDTRDFLQKEVSILNSIDENYKAAVKSEKNKENLRQSLVKITQGVKENLAKVGSRLSVEEQKKDALNSEYLKGLEEERVYYAMTKEFLVQCTKNQQLLEALGQ
eukprot:TRINITY_DN4359_c0_g1_i2.p1 TRINITY_DN4359_c0_g1~~TRINITY_DN4359_c0_g1_i2.p1  ORF type:complete len:522 (+),score=122.33 TRINITY_DN4359_c0_g1_i2:307-1872(+)